MIFRFVIGAAVLACAQGSLFAIPTYNFGSSTQVSLASTGYSAGVWNEIYYDGGSGTTQQIDCVVGLDPSDTSNSCGNPGPGSSKHINISTAGQPGNSGILPTGTTNYVEIDGDPRWGAPIWTTLTLNPGSTYQVTFFQASNEENGNDKAYNDNWLVYLLPGASSGDYICPQSFCSGVSTQTSIDSGDLVYASDVMQNQGASTTPWQEESFTFQATGTSAVLEFVTNAIGSPGFQPPLLDLAAVDVEDPVVPEPATWVMMIIGICALLAGTMRRRKLARVRSEHPPQFRR
jgi:hypothetical protein